MFADCRPHSELIEHIGGCNRTLPSISNGFCFSCIWCIEKSRPAGMKIA